VEQLVDFVADRLKPDVVLFSNALLVGVLERLKQRYSGRVYCLLQGDDVFLDDLQEPYKSQAIAMVSQRSQRFDGILVHSNYYRDLMSKYFNLPIDRFHKVPLGIDFDGYAEKPVSGGHDRFTVGYLARICPEKGLHQLIDAFSILRRRHPQVRLKAAGYCGHRDKEYLQSIMQQAEPLGDAFEYIGSPPGRTEKAAFLQSLDVLAVPTVYREPKGLYVLEAMANGVPVVQPDHGAFPELLELAPGGMLHRPGDANALSDAIEQLMLDPDLRRQLAVAGHAGVREHFNSNVMARQTLTALNR
jgi:glycosyltransferase involved in cell wall biosynthesis